MTTDRPELTAENRYRAQGERAFKNNETRESCRFKAADIVREWTAGWDAAKARRGEAQRKAAIPRWEAYGARGWGENATPPTAYYLKGDAPSLVVHRQQYSDDATAWFVSEHRFGIEGVALGTTDPDEAKRLAVLKVRAILQERDEALRAISCFSGALLSEVQS
jgi:hypothetical protein